MRRIIKEHNVYRWAGNLISELSEIRIDEAASAFSNHAEDRALRSAD